MRNFYEDQNIKRKVLIVEDEYINREILGNILMEEYDVEYACDGHEAWEKLAPSEYSLILLDLIMPVLSGSELLARIKNDPNLKSTPVIVMTSEQDAEVDSIRQGAADFITKPYDMPEVILARCERIIKLSEDARIIRSTERDTLTGLYSREYFFEYIRRIDTYIKDIKRDVLVLNINHFRLINEMYGRSTGDRVLKKVADTINEAFRSSLIIASRPVADTFYIYCENDGKEKGIGLLQEQLDKTFPELKLRLRAGIYQDADMKIAPEDRFDRAKQACDRIRGDYLSNVSYYDKEFHVRSVYNERLIKDVDSAIKNHDFLVYYQPKYNITGDTPKLCSAEALIRWKHPELGMISPGDFIPLFEHNGLIQKVDNYVWECAARQVDEWKKKLGYTLPVSVNVSRIDLFDPQLEEKLHKVLSDSGITENELMLEITESAYADDAAKVMEITEKLRSEGFKIEIDDFGSGYSSLNMIMNIPVDVLKLDRSFVKNLKKDEKSLMLVEIVIGIARFLNVPVVAEGVEDEDQLKTLKGMGCEIVQGFYFSRPVPAEEFEVFIKKEVERNDNN